jgi:hypothetical protein
VGWLLSSKSSRLHIFIDTPSFQQEIIQKKMHMVAFWSVCSSMIWMDGLEGGVLFSDPGFPGVRSHGASQVGRRNGMGRSWKKDEKSSW